MTTVYLSGGMHSGWQERVKEAVPGPNYLDPRECGLTDPAEYSAWDAWGIDTCDIVFAYLEADNPGGLGLAAEIGRASQSKVIILVDEKTPAGKPEARYLPLVRQWAGIMVDTFDEGIERLARLCSRNDRGRWF